MTHPAVYALGLTVAIGFALFSYFVTANPAHYNIPNQRQQQNPYEVPYQSNPNSSYDRDRSSPRRRRKSKDNDTMCSICLESIDDCHKKILPCHHTFHAACIRKLKESQSVLCPNCREPFE